MKAGPPPHVLLLLIQDATASQAFAEKHSVRHLVMWPLVFILVHPKNGFPLLQDYRIKPTLWYYVVALYGFYVCVMSDQVVDAEAAEC